MSILLVKGFNKNCVNLCNVFCYGEARVRVADEKKTILYIHPHVCYNFM